MWFQGFHILIPALFVTLCTIGIGTLFVMWAWSQVIYERITRARWKSPIALYVLMIAVLLDVVGLDSLWAMPNSLLHSPSHHICLFVMVGSFGSLGLCLVFARNDAGPGVLAVRVGSWVLLVISSLGFILMIMGLPGMPLE